jgi:ketosteroid isomerase-like protein
MKALTLIVVVGSLIGGLLGLLIATDEAKAETQVEQELLQLEREWIDAAVRRDTAKVGQILADEWEMVIAAGEVWTKETYLMLLKTGTLALESGENTAMNVRVYGDTAVVTGRGIYKGKYKGVDFSSDERWIDVFVKKNGRWQFVASQSTHNAKE